MFDIPYTTTVTNAKLPGLVLSMLATHFGVSLKIKAKFEQHGWLYLAVVNTGGSDQHSGLYVVHSSSSATRDSSRQFKIYHESECPPSGARCPQKLLDATAAFRTDTKFVKLSQTYSASMELLREPNSSGALYLFNGDGYQHPNMENKIVAWRAKGYVNFERLAMVALDSIGDEMHLECSKTGIAQHGFTKLVPAAHAPVFEPVGTGELVTLGAMVFQTTASGLQVAGAEPTESQLKQYRRERMAAAHKVAAEKAVPKLLFL